MPTPSFVEEAIAAAERKEKASAAMKNGRRSAAGAKSGSSRASPAVNLEEPAAAVAPPAVVTVPPDSVGSKAGSSPSTAFAQPDTHSTNQTVDAPTNIASSGLFFGMPKPHAHVPASGYGPFSATTNSSSLFAVPESGASTSAAESSFRSAAVGYGPYTTFVPPFTTLTPSLIPSTASISDTSKDSIPFLRLPVELRIKVYRQLWRVTACPNERRNFRPREASCWFGPDFLARVFYPSVVMRMDQRIKNEFTGELCREFALYLYFGPDVARHLHSLPIETPPNLFMANLRRCHIEYCICHPRLRLSLSEHNTVANRPSLEAGIHNIVRSLESSELLGEITVAVHVCPRDLGLLIEVLYGISEFVWSRPAPSIRKVKAILMDHRSRIWQIECDDTVWEIWEIDSSIHEDMDHIEQQRRQHNSDTCVSSSCREIRQARQLERIQNLVGQVTLVLISSTVVADAFVIRLEMTMQLLDWRLIRFAPVTWLFSITLRMMWVFTTCSAAHQFSINRYDGRVWGDICTLAVSAACLGDGTHRLRAVITNLSTSINHSSLVTGWQKAIILKLVSLGHAVLSGCAYGIGLGVRRMTAVAFSLAASCRVRIVAIQIPGFVKRIMRFTANIIKIAILLPVSIWTLSVSALILTPLLLLPFVVFQFVANVIYENRYPDKRCSTSFTTRPLEILPCDPDYGVYIFLCGVVLGGCGFAYSVCISAHAPELLDFALTAPRNALVCGTQAMDDIEVFVRAVRLANTTQSVYAAFSLRGVCRGISTLLKKAVIFGGIASLVSVYMTGIGGLLYLLYTTRRE